MQFAPKTDGRRKDAQRVLAVPDHARGKLVRCRSCGTNIRIPAERPLPSLDPEPLEMPEPQEGLEGEG